MSTPKNDGGPAFPMYAPDGNGCGPYAQFGMTLRDWFAGQALAGLLAKGIGAEADEFATNSYAVADAMLAAREGKQ